MTTTSAAAVAAGIVIAVVAAVGFCIVLPVRNSAVSTGDELRKSISEYVIAPAISISSSGTGAQVLEIQIPEAAMHGRSGVDVSTPSGRQAYYDHLVTLPPKEIFQAWISASSTNNPDEVSQLVAALGFSLRRNRNDFIYTEIGAKLLNKSNKVPDRLGAADALMLAATPEALDQLIKFLQEAYLK